MQACGWAGTSASQGIPSQDAGNALLLTLSQSEQAAFFPSSHHLSASHVFQGVSLGEVCPGLSWVKP